MDGKYNYINSLKKNLKFVYVNVDVKKKKRKNKKKVFLFFNSYSIFNF